MKIGIAANYLLFEPAGIGKYTENLLKNLFKIDHKNQYFLYFSYLRHRRARLKLIQKRLGKLPKNVTMKIFPIPAAWLEYLLSTRLPLTNYLTENLDVFFSPYVSSLPKKGFTNSNTRIVSTIHDLVFMRFPSHRGRSLSNSYFRRHKIAVEVSCKIIVPSKATKEDLEKFLKVNSRKITIIPEAADSRFRVIKKNADQNEILKVIGKYFDANKKYILTVGTLEPRKNLAKLVEAFSILPYQILKEYCLVIVGGKGWNNQLLEKTINNLNIKDKVILAGFVLDEDLPYIYNGASIFVYPSLYEGFGLPPLEALACGIPIIASKVSSLPEIIGDAGLFVNPQSEVEIASAIKKLLGSPNLRKKLAKRGLLRAQKYSWAKTAQKTLDVFERV